MADKEQIKQTVIKVLGYVQEIFEFASSIDPRFGFVTSLVGVVRKGLGDEEDKEVDKYFRQVHEKLESISAKNKQTLQRIHMAEVKETCGQYEQYIKHQYGAFKTMVERVKVDPENAGRYMEDFKKIYEIDKSDLSLNVFYDRVMGNDLLFSSGRDGMGRPLLKVYLEHCGRKRKLMEASCSHLVNLFYIGLIALMAYTSVTGDDEKEVREKWAQRVIDIQDKMQEVLKKCNEEGLKPK